MKKEKPLILLSNDDGVEAKGLNELIRGLRGMGEIIVMFGSFGGDHFRASCEVLQGT